VDYTSLSDTTLFLLISRAQPQALDELYNRYSHMVFGLALGLVGDRATAEEIALDVFTKVWRKADTYQADQAKVSTWLISVTRHQAIDVLRRQEARPRYLAWSEVSPLIAPDGQNPEKAAELNIQQQKIRAAMAQLPEEQKQALGLAYFAGYTHRQIAEALDQPLGTVKTRIRLALQKLRNLLRDEQIAGG
jgi:RNA polymerase sigma-70 factor (ECF subfamily)